MNRAQHDSNSVGALIELERRLAVIDAIIDIRTLVDRGTDQAEIAQYYIQSNWGYRHIHSREGAIHMALNPDGKFDRRGFAGQCKLVEEYIDDDVATVLELGSGNGFNLRYLAARRPHVRFIGVDLVPHHVTFARRRSASLPNVVYKLGDFHRLDIADDSVDLVYSIESFCHATDLDEALGEARRVLAPGGHLVIVDAWRTDEFRNLPVSVQRASHYAETAMSVGRPTELSTWKAAARAAGLAVVRDRELTDQVMPNLERFERMAHRGLRWKAGARLAMKLVPERLFANAVAGYLMPLTVEQGAHTYRMLVLAKTAAIE